jgi:hypothetical protein
VDEYESETAEIAEAKDGGAEPDRVNGAGLARQENKPETDCRTRCMHCGLHCIYLNNESEEERT